jgi:molybdate transport system substrate-binding protein
MTRRGVLALMLAVAACSGPASDDDGPLTVFAAASLIDVLSAVGEAYEAGGGEVRFSFAGTSALTRQLEQGAPAAVFISADEAWMDYAEARGLIEPDTRVDLLANRLALVAPATSQLCFAVEAGMPLAAELGPDGRLAIAAPEVPAGRYAQAALTALGVWDNVEDRLARGENVRTALQFVARGEAPYGVVYQTDALIDPAVRVVGLFPEESHPPIVYPAAIVAGRSDLEASAFLAWLQGEEAGAIFTDFGFFRP